MSAPTEATLVRVADETSADRTEIHVIDGKRVVFTRRFQEVGYFASYFHADYCDCGVCMDDGGESQWHRRGIEHPCKALGGKVWRP